MKTTTKSKRRIPVLLSILCAGLVATFLGDVQRVRTWRMTPVIIRPAIIRTRSYDYYPYSYYGPSYDTTVVRSGVRYNDAYGPRLLRTRTVYGDW